MIAAATPVTIVPVEGVRNFGCTCRNSGGSRPSRAMAKKMRACAMVITSMTEVMPAIAPSFTG